ncbi:hypothetical protein AB0J82_17310 [Asanoa sp. NPDC049518]|uniref:hypothetical protein n=1 Tax=unclassified Asanoa TaxID=2685164 RepID=UPI003426A968
MSAEPSGPAVVAFGADEPRADGSWPFGARLHRVFGDRRMLTTVAAALAGAAACAALIAPWFSVMLPLGESDPNSGQQAERLTEFHVGDLGTLAVGFLLCLLILTVATVLAVAGPPASRAVARLTGLTVAGASLAVLVATTANIDNYILRSFFFLFQEEIDVDYRGGLTFAFVAVLLAGLALLLSGRPREVGPESEATTGAAWGWPPQRTTRDKTAAEIAAAAPLDLTVQPARPFTHPDGGDDRGR